MFISVTKTATFTYILVLKSVRSFSLSVSSSTFPFVQLDWNLVYEATKPEFALIYGEDDRLFRRVGEEELWVNDNNHTSGTPRMARPYYF
jgi:hypothetical protein